MLCIGWAVIRLAKIEPQLARDHGQSEELPAIFRECKELFRGSLENPELTRREFDLVWYDALLLKAEYLGIADRLESHLPELAGAISDPSAQRGHTDLPPRMLELRNWIAKQKDRAGLERLEIRSKELKERIAREQLSATNGPPARPAGAFSASEGDRDGVKGPPASSDTPGANQISEAPSATNGSLAITSDLGTLLKEIDRTYESYLSDFKGVTSNAGKPLVDGFVAQRLDQARKAVGLLSDLAGRARRDGKAIEVFLAARSHSDAAKRTRRQEEVIRAFLEAGSPTEFGRRIRSASGDSSPELSAVSLPSLRAVRYGLVAVLVVLGVFLIVDLNWRTVVMPLRMKLVERETILEEQEKLANFEQLAAALAHEIRNPLTTINARLYTVQRKLPEGTPERKDAMIIGNEIDRVSQILKDFIQLTRPAPPELALMAAEPLLKDVRDLMAPQLQQRAVRLELQSQGKAQFRGDRQQLKQVLINLVQNAAESMVREGVIILRTRDDSILFKGTQSNVALIEVEDNGPGIPSEAQGRLFEPFFSTRKDGTGLGLPISARIIDRHGGTLEFETQAGRGTIFRIVLPAGEEQ